MNFVDFVYYLERMGVADVLLPFFLVFVLIFAILQRTKILGDNAKKYNIVVAIVMGAAVVLPHIIGTGPDIVPIINRALPNVSVVIVAIVMFLVLLGAFGMPYDIGGKKMGGLISLIAIAIIIYIFGASAGVGWWIIPDWLWFLRDPETVTFLIIILVFGLIIMYITKEESPESRSRSGKTGGWFEDWIVAPTRRSEGKESK